MLTAGFHFITDAAERSPLAALGPTILRPDRFAQHTRAELTKCEERGCGELPSSSDQRALSCLLSADLTHAGTIPVPLNRTDAVA